MTGIYNTANRMQSQAMGNVSQETQVITAGNTDSFSPEPTSQETIIYNDTSSANAFLVQVNSVTLYSVNPGDTVVLAMSSNVITINNTGAGTVTAHLTNIYDAI